MRELPFEAKAEQVVALIRAAREMAMVGLRRRYPEAPAEELRLRLAALVLDADTVRKAYGWDPTREGH